MWMIDSLVNLLSGLGTSKDKGWQSTYTWTPLSRAQLDAAYRGDWVARKIVNIPAFDSTRAWRSWQADNDDVEKIEEEESRLNIKLRLMDAMIKARLYGGGGLVLGLKRGVPSEPLDVDTVRAGDLEFVHAVGRHELGTGPRITDIMSPWYGAPEYYTSTNGMHIHPSRVIRLLGNALPDASMSSDVWGDSVLQSVDDAVKAFGNVNASIATLISEAKIDIIKVPGLTNALQTKDGTSKIQTRFVAANSMKSIINTLLLDTGEEWERLTTNLAGYPEVIQMYILIASGAGDIPATRMLGQSPAGMNATGESDTRNYYDRISADQEMCLKPALTTLDEVLIRSALGSRDPSIFYNWNPLWQMDDAQRADVALKKAQTFKIDVDAMVFPDEVLRKARENQLIEDGTYPGVEAAIEEFKNVDPEPPAPDPALLAAAAAQGKLPPSDTKRLAPPRRAGANDALLFDATPRTLYVRRDVINVSDIKEWASAQGLDNIEEGLHVTIAYSRAQVDWMKIGEDWYGPSDGDGRLTIAPGGARIVEKLGPQEAVVLMFTSSALSWRWRSLKDAGASWSYQDYQPHITITYALPEGVSAEDIDPYKGPIILGPEVWEELDELRGNKTDDAANTLDAPRHIARDIADALRNVAPPIVNVTIGPRGKVVKEVIHDADGRVSRIIETEEGAA